MSGGYKTKRIKELSNNNLLIFINAPQHISDALGHELETHFKTSSRFNPNLFCPDIRFSPKTPPCSYSTGNKVRPIPDC